MLEEVLFTEKYRPKTIAETILPEDLKKTFQSYVDQKMVPNLLLSGPPGVGKTTVAKAMLEQLGCDYIVINGSMNGNIDTLRNEIKQFASSVSMTGGRKYVILDEADGLNASSTQSALRNFMEEFAKNAGFILTCNFKNKIIEAVRDRTAVVDFKIKRSEYPVLAKQFMHRAMDILEREGIEYDKAALVGVIKKFVPSWRRTLNELQRYSATGKIDSGILTDMGEVSMRELMSLLKDKDFTGMRKWVAENLDNDPTLVYRRIFDQAQDYLTKESLPAVILVLGKYQYQHSFVSDGELNLVCCLTEVMVEATFK